MKSFSSLTAALEGWFDKPQSDLPHELRLRVEEEFWPIPWDSIQAEGRRSVARQIDFTNDPELEQVRNFWWDHADRKISILEQIAKWESIPTLSAGDLGLKETRLIELQRDLVKIEAEGFVPTTESYSEDQLALISTVNVQNNTEISSPEWRSQNARKAANARHDKPGASREKQRQIQEIWASGKYNYKDVCAEQECAALEMSYSAARRALQNAPKPSLC